jgi:hypothetical protein
MARVVLTERPDSRKWTVGEGAAFELRYNAVGSSDPLRVRDVAAAELPLWWEGFIRTNIGIEPDPTVVDSALGKGLWLVIGSYEPPTVNGVKQSFDTSGGTFHITQSLFTRDKYALPGKTPTDHKGAINADGEKVQGVDIVVPVYQFTETYELSPFIVTPTYRITLFTLTGVLNNAKFRGFIRGECLFMGASGTLDQQGNYQVDFKFASSPELRDFKVGEITVGLKRGWDYIWVSYEKQSDADSGKLALRPSEVHVERVYREGNFAALGIGTGLVPTVPG